MSYSINVLQRYLETVSWPIEVRALIDAIHEYSHANEDALNHDRNVRFAAARLEEWLDKQDDDGS